MSVPYVAPQADLKAFNCPFCNAYAQVHWSHIQATGDGGRPVVTGNMTAYCTACKKWTLWCGVVVNKDGKVAHSVRLAHPRQVTAPLPNPDMPADCRADFEEARMIAADSPRAAAALLRLCVERLCTTLNAKGSTLNQMIGDLVTRGLATDVQRALDIVRVTGDKSIHAGTINPGDDPEVAAALFGLVNEIVSEMISRPKRIEALYGKLPPGSLDQIERRDGQK